MDLREMLALKVALLLALAWSTAEADCDTSGPSDDCGGKEEEEQCMTVSSTFK